MVTTFPVAILVSTVLGFLASLGVGGGSLLVLWLTFIAGFEQETARNINLMFYIPGALIASFFQIRKGNLHLRQLLPAILCGCIAAVLTTFLAGFLDTGILRKIMGILFLIIGMREIFYRPRKAR